MRPLNLFLLLLASLCSLLYLDAAQPFDYPTANFSAKWTNSPSLDHTVSFADGATVRAILLRGQFGPSFGCGFFCTGTCNTFLLSIFIVYTNSGSQMTGVTYASPQVVWSANRHHLVKENATLQFENGSLVLRDADGSLAWSTNTSGMPVMGMNLTEIGHLELVDRNNASVWSSADHPTDSWVLGQTLRQGQRLTSNSSATNWTQGQLSLEIVNGGFAAYAGFDPPQMYYQNVNTTKMSSNKVTYITFTNGSLAIFTESNDKGSPDSTVPLPRASFLQYMRLDYGGHLRLYEWNETGWILLRDVISIFEYGVYSATFDDCAFPTVCGEYGVCSNGQCSCASGTDGDSTYFRQVDERQPNLGCAPVTPLSCQSLQRHQLIALDNASYFNYVDPNAAAISGTSVEVCQEACLKNCSCKAALFQSHGNASDGFCYLPLQLFSLQNNKPDISHFNSSAYIKVQIPQVRTPNPSNSSERKKISAAVVAGATVGALLVAFLAIIFIVVLVKKKKRQELAEEDQFDMVPGLPTRFSFEELKVATENFCRKLGEGGFGSVFEGTLGDGTKVAVKRLDGVGQGKKEFLAEVETIGSVHHINLVRLIGFCAEKSHRLLVYEYMCNGSLDKWIFSKNHDHTLDWQTRCRIITDIAKGLSYLHEECRQKIAHLDIKPQNILLGEEYNAKVSDFGLSKLIDRDQSQVMTRMRGTPGYLAPEWLTSLITEKADVFSFGVVVLEIVCGRKNLDYTQPEESFHLVCVLQDKMTQNRLSDIIDSRSTDMQIHVHEAIEILKLAMWCLQSDCNKRPLMSTVVKVLEGSAKAETNIDYDFSSPAPLVSRNANNNSSPSAWLLSGPR